MQYPPRASDPPDTSRIVDYRSPDGERVHSVRSTLIASSLTTLRELGLFERYQATLPEEYRDRILYSIAPEWLPVEVGESHYRNCDALGLTDRELEKIGEMVAARIMGTFLGTLLRTSGQNVGASPWIALAKYDVLWSRLMQGGSCTVDRVGPKDALIRSHGASLFDTRYFRVAYHGVVRGALGMFSPRVMGRTDRVPSSPHSLVTTMSWV